MLRKSLWSVLATLVLVVGSFSLHPPAADADAADWLASAVPEWAYDAADSITDGCNDLPATLVGTGSAGLAYAVPKFGAGGAASLSVTGTATGGAAAAGTAVTGANAFIVGGVAVGAFCGTVIAGDWAFGDSDIDGVPAGPGQMTSDALTKCSEMSYSMPDGAGADDYCVRINVDPGVSVPEDFRAMPRVLSVPNDTGIPSGGTSWLPEVGRLGTVFPYATCTYIFSSSGCTGGNRSADEQRPLDTNRNAFYVLPCATPAVKCGLLDYMSSNDVAQFGPGVAVRRRGIPGSGGIYSYAGSVAIAPELWELGKPRRLSSTTRCKRPSDGNETIESNVSGVFFDTGDTVDHIPARCPDGYAPIEIDIVRQKATGGANVPATWAPDGSIITTWDADPTVVSNPTSLACFVVGVTYCPSYDPDPENPTGVLELGGPGGTEYPKGTPTLREAVRDLLRAAPWPDTDPRLSPSTTTTAVTSTTAVTTTTSVTTTTTVDPCSGGAPSTACTPLDPSEDPTPGESGECFPSGWGWLNPVEWVLKPVKCALVWAFWDQDAADEIADLTAETGWPDLVSDSSFDTSTATGPCIPIDETEICTQPILEIEAPEYVQVLIAALVSFFVVFEVVGLFSRITRT